MKNTIVVRAPYLNSQGQYRSTRVGNEEKIDKVINGWVEVLIKKVYILQSKCMSKARVGEQSMTHYGVCVKEPFKCYRTENTLKPSFIAVVLLFKTG